jgi:hypothetical protein
VVVLLKLQLLLGSIVKAEHIIVVGESHQHRDNHKADKRTQRPEEEKERVDSFGADALTRPLWGCLWSNDIMGYKREY